MKLKDLRRQLRRQRPTKTTVYDPAELTLKIGEDISIKGIDLAAGESETGWLIETPDGPDRAKRIEKLKSDLLGGKSMIPLERDEDIRHLTKTITKPPLKLSAPIPDARSRPHIVLCRHNIAEHAVEAEALDREHRHCCGLRKLGESLGEIIVNTFEEERHSVWPSGAEASSVEVEAMIRKFIETGRPSNEFLAYVTLENTDTIGRNFLQLNLGRVVAIPNHRRSGITEKELLNYEIGLDIGCSDAADPCSGVVRMVKLSDCYRAETQRCACAGRPRDGRSIVCPICRGVGARLVHRVHKFTEA